MWSALFTKYTTSIRGYFELSFWFQEVPMKDSSILEILIKGSNPIIGSNLLLKYSNLFLATGILIFEVTLKYHFDFQKYSWNPSRLDSSILELEYTNAGDTQKGFELND